MDIKEYQIRQNEFKRPVLITKDVHNIQKVHEMAASYDNSEVFVEALEEIFDVSQLAEEYVWMFCLNSAFRITGVFEVSHGAINSALFCSREILQKALLAGATGIVLAHCHPSGMVSPSSRDICVTKQLYDACNIIGIQLYDHVIVGCDSSLESFSFKKEKMMVNW